MKESWEEKLRKTRLELSSSRSSLVRGNLCLSVYFKDVAGMAKTSHMGARPIDPRKGVCPFRCRFGRDIDACWRRLEILSRRELPPGPFVWKSHLGCRANVNACVHASTKHILYRDLENFVKMETVYNNMEL